MVIIYPFYHHYFIYFFFETLKMKKSGYFIEDGGDVCWKKNFEIIAS